MSENPEASEGAVYVPSEPSHRADVPEDVPPGRGKHRRVTTDVPPGTDPNPTAEPARHSSTENDEQLRRDKPPHWG
ncbi:MAG: hypothetical protein KF761_03155 [Salinibacterium sp.]|nr:hypothetical protein [Salinibacterium sp.]